MTAPNAPNASTQPRQFLEHLYHAAVVRAHGGEVAVESGDGEGTCFRFVLPR